MLIQFCTVCSTVLYLYVHACMLLQCYVHRNVAYIHCLVSSGLDELWNTKCFNLHKYMNSLSRDCNTHINAHCMMFSHVLLCFTCGSCTLVLPALTFLESRQQWKVTGVYSDQKICFCEYTFLQLQHTTIANVVTMATMSNTPAIVPT